MFKKFLILLAMLVFISVLPVSAVKDGELDGDRHPHVVLILIEIDGAPKYRCSGTLISPTIVLTAGHCVSNYPDSGSVTGLRVFTEANVEGGNNNYPFAGSNAVEAVDWAAHPLYETAPFFVHDVGMIRLAEEITVHTYGTLPSVDQFDSLQVGKKTTFTSVGYGLQLVNPVFIQADRVRMLARPHLIQINVPGFTGDFSMLLSNNHATGGTCFGDSGGANFLGDSNLVAGVTSFGINGNCAGTGGVFRTDRANVLNFIYNFINS